MPVRVAVTLQVEDPLIVLPQDLHAHVSKWLDSAPAGTHHQSDKPWAIGRVGCMGSTWRIEINLLDGALVSHLAEQLKRAMHSTLRLGKHDSRTTDAVIDRSAPPVVEADIPWCAFKSEAQAVNAWDIVTHSPMLTRRGNLDLVFPNPLGLVRGLYRRFAIWCPPADSPFADHDDPRFPVLVVRSFNAHSVDVPQKEGSHVGFMGEFRLMALNADPQTPGEATSQQLMWVDMLLNFAEFAGLGSMTPRGFGAVEVVHA